MATNRFAGSIFTPKDLRNSELEGIEPGKLETLNINGVLSEGGLGTDTSGNEDYSSTATFFSFKADAESVIHRVVLVLENGNVDETTLKDTTEFLGGESALTNGIIFGVASEAGEPDLFACLAASSIEQLVRYTGGEICRSLNVSSATNTVNHDSVILTIDFASIWGVPLKLAKNQLVGFYLQDDLSGLSNVKGSAFGRLI